jgi:hypothetical protein
MFPGGFVKEKIWDFFPWVLEPDKNQNSKEGRVGKIDPPVPD